MIKVGQRSKFIMKGQSSRPTISCGKLPCTNTHTSVFYVCDSPLMKCANGLVHCTKALDGTYTCPGARPVWVPGCPEPPFFFSLKMQDFASFFEKFPGDAPLEGHRRTRPCQHLTLSIDNAVVDDSCSLYM